MKKILASILVVILSSLISGYAVLAPVDSEYSTWIPIASSSRGVDKSGLAIAYAYMNHETDSAQVSWVHNWGDCSLMPAVAQEKCTPMAWGGDAPDDVEAIGSGYDGWLIVFNEPDNPYQANLTPSAAVDKYIALKSAYPSAKMVVGNVTDINGPNWLTQFIDECEGHDPECVLPDTWGYHAYIEGAEQYDQHTAEGVISILEDEHEITGGDVWITEWAETHGFSLESATEAQELRDFMDETEWITRWFYFTSRDDPEDAYEIVPGGWVPTHLFDDATGLLTDWGYWFFYGYIPAE